METSWSRATPNNRKKLKEIVKSGELDENSVIRKIRITDVTPTEV